MPRTLDEIQRTPAGLLAADEINMLDADGQAHARAFQERQARERACPGHEPVGASTYEEARRGLHRAKCRYCGADMSTDSGG